MYIANGINLLKLRMCHQRQLKTFNATSPLIHGDLLEQNRIICHSTVDECLEYQSPRIVIASNSDFEGESMIFLQKSKVYDNFMFVIPDTTRVSHEILSNFPNAKVLCYTHENNYSTIPQLQQLVEQIKPSHVIAHDQDHLSGVIELGDIQIQCDLPFEILSIPFGDHQQVDLTGSVYKESRGAEPATIHMM